MIFALFALVAFTVFTGNTDLFLPSYIVISICPVFPVVFLIFLAFFELLRLSFPYYSFPLLVLKLYINFYSFMDTLNFNVHTWRPKLSSIYTCLSNNLNLLEQFNSDFPPSDLWAFVVMCFSSIFTNLTDLVFYTINALYSQLTFIIRLLYIVIVYLGILENIPCSLIHIFS